MASGFGLNGGPSRCYNFWQEVLGCYVVNAGDGETGKKKCMPALEDYYECLHHRKEVGFRPCTMAPCPSIQDAVECPVDLALRTMKMQAAYRKAEAAHPRENAPKAEQIRSLGLLGKEEEASAFLTKA
ncbi:NADH-ubiquinone oxidoreductase kD subunit [Aspergillus flavus]|nr:NADH-ubiquinone oxidoreductase kD subunit [Aspergillus flavus]